MRNFTLLAFCSIAASGLMANDYPVQPVPFTAVKFTGGFWAERQEINRTVTVPFALQQCEESGRLKNFDLAAEVMRRRAAGEKDFQITPPTSYPFDDTDVYKAIEAASYVLSVEPNPTLEHKLDEWIEHVAAAQEPDGYLYTFRTMHPDSPGHKWVGQQRWEQDPVLSHELYNIGHLYEAGVAHFQATGKRSLLDVCLKNAELVWRDFGDGQRKIAPGHQIIEMGLVKLHRVTGDARWLKLAQIFLAARGPGEDPYNQRHLRVVDQTAAVGHAVRANYMYSGMADVAALTGDARYLHAIQKIGEDVVSKKLYLTGSVGALAKGEAYGAEYELPLDGYNETCAAVALMMWNQRMFLLTGEARYMDLFERTAYNGFISGVSLSGDRFFYPNPLIYDGKSKNNHDHAGRAPWFGCACCPPNLARELASLSGNVYAVRGDTLFVNLYAQSEAETTVAGQKVKLIQSTNYPWDGRVRLTVHPENPGKFTVKLRIPGWARGQPVPSDLYRYKESTPQWTARIGATKFPAQLENGYVVVSREWQAGEVVELKFPMVPHHVTGHPAITATHERVALERGPIVYCVEALEKEALSENLGLPARAAVKPRILPDLLGGVTVLKIGRGSKAITAIPYYTWNNRGLAPMSVWLKDVR